MMLTPSDRPVFDFGSVSGIFGDAVLRANKDMVEFMHRGVKLTLYPNASVMFYHFTDRDTAFEYADEVMGMLTSGRR